METSKLSKKKIRKNGYFSGKLLNPKDVIVFVGDQNALASPTSNLQMGLMLENRPLKGWLKS